MLPHRPNHLLGNTCATCPLCKTFHKGPGKRGDGSSLGSKIYADGAECPICREVVSPLIALPCGHVFCEEDFHRILERQQTPTIPTRRVIRARRPPLNQLPIANQGSAGSYEMQAVLATTGLATPSFVPNMPSPSHSSKSSSLGIMLSSPSPRCIRVNRQVPGSAEAVSASITSNVPSLYVHPPQLTPVQAGGIPAPAIARGTNPDQGSGLMKAPVSPPFALSTYARSGTIPNESRQRRIEPKRRKLYHPSDFSNGADGATMQPWTRREKDSARITHGQKRGRTSTHTTRVWSPHISYS